jgi:hypothetical protein
MHLKLTLVSGADCVKTQRTDFSLKGCQIVAGGRSLAQTTGKECPGGPYPGGVPPFSATRSGCGIIFRLLSGGLRYAATTGYHLTALQAEIHSLRFTRTRAAHGSVTQRASQIN